MEDIRNLFARGGASVGKKKGSTNPKQSVEGISGKRPREVKAKVSAAAFFGAPNSESSTTSIPAGSASSSKAATSPSEPVQTETRVETKSPSPSPKKRRVERPDATSKHTPKPTPKHSSASSGTKAKGSRAIVLDSDDSDFEADEASPKPTAAARGSPAKAKPKVAASTRKASPSKSGAKGILSRTKKSASKEKRTSPKFRGEREGLEEGASGEGKPAVEAALAAFKDGDVAGHHAALGGDRFVFTGTHHLLEREEMEELCKLHGGRVMSAVSGTTWALVAGPELEDGRAVQSGSKWAAAEEKDVAVWSMERFVQEILTRSRPLQQEERRRKERAAGGGGGAAAPPSLSASPFPSGSGARTGLSQAEQRSDATQSLWADRFAPSSQDDLVGHATNFAKLRSWLQHWDKRHLRGGANGKVLRPPVDKARASEQPEKKAVLISGPPGIGKTTAAHLVAKICGREIFELNASDTRSKKGLRERMGSVIGTQVLAWHGKSLDGSVNAHRGTGARRVIIMDEVDGLGASDRGGNGELIQIIKKTRTPIICLCNDRQKSSVRSLANSCFDLKFMRPQKGAIAKAMAPIARRAGLQVDVVTLEQIAESCGNDMRQVLGMLQMQARTRSRLTYQDFSEEQRAVSKDEALRHTAFTALPTMFSRSVSVRERYEAFFVDYDLLPLMVAQSYPSAVLGAGGPEGALSKLHRLSEAAQSCSDGDVVALKVRQRQQWQLLPSQAALNVRAGWYGTGRVQASFPDWLGRNSARNKRSRLVSELTVHMSGRVSGGLRSVRLDYAPAMLRLLLQPLGRSEIERAMAGIQSGAITAEDVAAAAGGGGSAGGKKKAKAKKLQPATAAATLCAHRAIDNMDVYGLSREDVVETLPELGLGGAQSVWQSMDSKSKSAFTRAYNSRSHRSQGLHVAGKSAPAGASQRGKAAGLAFAKGKKGKGKAGKATAAGADSEDEEEGDAVDEGAALEAGMLGVE